MKEIVKKNKIVLFTIALMLVVAGYMNYTMNIEKTIETAAIMDSEKYADLGDARLVSSEPAEEQNIENTTTTAAIVENVDSESSKQYFVQSRIDRDNMFSQMIDSYEKLLSNEKISTEQRNIAENEIVNVNNRKNAIMISENLIKNKGFEDVIIFVNDKSINVIIRADDLDKEQVAQVQNIIQREMNTDVENIHISNK